MNKDVIYIEPEDDITDIITKIENSKEKIVALVPPKKAGVFRSVVNIKLISKVGVTAEKTIVLVTTDPSIVKLAAATKIPVTKNLQTPPAIPTANAEIEETSEEELVDEPEEEAAGLVEEEIAEEPEEDEEEPEENSTKKDRKTNKSEKKARKSKKDDKEGGNPLINWIKNHKKTAIFGGVMTVALIVFLVWAFAFAPAATVTVGIKTETNNFAENVTFSTNAADENAAEGKFYLQEKKIETAQEVKFEATGKKNRGEKASGEVIAYTYFKKSGNVAINSGTSFSINGLSFISQQNVTLSWDGKTASDCENNGEASAITSGCLIYGKVAVVAAEPGSKYNVSASQSGWSTVANVSGAYSDKAMAGGTDDIVTVVEQADIERAKNELKASNESENKEKLLSEIGDNMLVIESSFTQDTATAVATPAAGEEVKEGDQPVLKATTTASVYAIDKSKMEEFIKEKAKLGDDQKVYEIKDPYIENFVKGDTGYAGRLKTSYAVGPKVTENDIVEMIKGKGLGDAQHDLKNINGVVDVSIDTSYPWVLAIPGDTNKITVNIEIKDN